MEYSELKLYNLQGGDTFRKKNIDTENTKIDENDKKVLRIYKKKIIEQRNEIDRLKQKLKQMDKKEI